MKSIKASKSLLSHKDGECFAKELMSSLHNLCLLMALPRRDLHLDVMVTRPLHHGIAAPSRPFINAELLQRAKVANPFTFNGFHEGVAGFIRNGSHSHEASCRINHNQRADLPLGGLVRRGIRPNLAAL